ncbi:MAG: phosphotransferase family protein [Acidimicrobiales bacterium]
MRDELRRWLTDEVGEPVTVDIVGRTAGGFSRENWVVDAAWGGAHHRLIARRDPPGSVLVTDRAVEAAVLRALEETAVPAPRLRWADLTDERCGRPCLVMDLVTGVCDGLVLAGERPEAEWKALAHRIYDQLAAIHQVDWAALDLGDVLADPGPHAAMAAVEHWETELRREQLEPEPELTFVIGWLRDHAPANEATVLVHGDFKPGNVLLDGDRVTAVLDWETAHLGDPHEDLGWVTNPLRAREHRIPGVWEPAHLLERWSATTGRTVDPEALRWWQVLANLKLAVIVVTGMRAFAEGRLDRIHQSPVGIHRLLLDQIGA